MSQQDTFGGPRNDVPEIDDSIAGFYNFVAERYRIYRRKEISHLNPPWTIDPILQEYHFCNVKRQHDAGTQFYLEHVAPRSKTTFRGESEIAEDLFIRTIIYRILNNPESYREIEDYIAGRETDFTAIVETLRDRDENVFSAAYRIGGPNHTPYDDKLGQLLYAGVRDDLMSRFDEICDGTIYADSLEAANQPLRDIRGLGPFFTYEVTVDLNYVWFDFHEDDFVNVGPGAAKGLELIYGDDSEARLWELQKEQDEYLPDESLYLTARDVEHCLCEFSKYIRVKTGGTTRRYQ